MWHELLVQAVRCGGWCGDRRLLEAQKASAERWQDASAKRMKVAEWRLKQLESLSKL